MWCRRTDELVDGPNASHITPKALDRWEKRLNDLFDGHPYDMYDAALADTVSTYPVDIQVHTAVLANECHAFYFYTHMELVFDSIPTVSSAFQGYD